MAELIRSDARAIPLADESVQCVVTSPHLRTCSVEGCGTAISGRGRRYCSLHSEHIRKNRKNAANVRLKNRIRLALGKPSREEKTIHVCTLDDCDKPHLARGLCSMHYRRFMKTGQTEPLPDSPKSQKGVECGFDDCGRLAVSTGLCNTHYEQKRRTGAMWPITSRPGTMTCHFCDGTFKPSRMDARFCSARCRQKYFANQIAEERAAVIPRQLTCKRCSKSYHRPRAHGGRSFYCSTKCSKQSAKENKKKPLQEVPCTTCGAVILTTFVRKTRYCSNLCRQKGESAAAKARGRKTYPRSSPLPCRSQGCGTPRHGKEGLCRLHMKIAEAGGADAYYKAKHVVRPIGSIRVNVDGYADIKVGLRDWRRHHAWVMEQDIGRPLFPKEEVHHINGEKADNRIENLELWSKSHPYGQRVIDKIRWAEDLLKLYKPQRHLFEDLPLG